MRLKDILKYSLILGIILGLSAVLFGIAGYRIGLSKPPIIQTVFKEATVSAVLTTCNNPDCGSIVIPKSQCSDTAGFVCCFLQNGKRWYSSREACKLDQDSGKIN